MHQVQIQIHKKATKYKYKYIKKLQRSVVSLAFAKLWHSILSNMNPVLFNIVGGKIDLLFYELLGYICVRLQNYICNI